MPFSESLASRIRDALLRTRGIEEKKMFGGIGILLNGNMLIGVWRDSLIVRIGPDSYEAVLREPHVQEFDVTGRPMKGWVVVAPDGLESDEQLVGWIDRAETFVGTLPRK